MAHGLWHAVLLLTEIMQMECAQLEITGGGSTTPSGVSFPGAYKGSDPGKKYFSYESIAILINVHKTGITVNIYYPPLTSYTIPGKCLFSNISIKQLHSE